MIRPDEVFVIGGFTLDSVETDLVLKINAPGFFTDPDFVAWLQGRRKNQEGRKPATWHQGTPEKPVPPDDWSDVFITYEDGEGSDSDAVAEAGIPTHIWDVICELCKQAKFDEGLIWIKNLAIDHPVKEGQ